MDYALDVMKVFIFLAIIMVIVEEEIDWEVLTLSS